eukprot:1253462-Lingulodinium_polyedra.AAC.1
MLRCLTPVKGAARNHAWKPASTRSCSILPSVPNIRASLALGLRASWNRDDTCTHLAACASPLANQIGPHPSVLTTSPAHAAH